MALHDPANRGLSECRHANDDAVAACDYNALPAPSSFTELAAYWRPYIEPPIEAFGAKRRTFESNFPVDMTGIDYRVLWDAQADRCLRLGRGEGHD